MSPYAEFLALIPEEGQKTPAAKLLLRTIARLTNATDEDIFAAAKQAKADLG